MSQRATSGMDFPQLTPVERANELLPPLTTRLKERVSCPDPSHDDVHPSAVLEPDRFRCWSCGAHGDKLDHYALTHGLTIRQALERLGVLDGSSPRRSRVVEPSYCISRDIARRLVATDQFARHWHLAKLLALPDPLLAQRDILSGWDYLQDNGYDIPLVWDLAKLLRGEALLRFGDASRATDPAEPGRAVCRLLRSLEEAVAA